MKWSSAVSDNPALADAVSECAERTAEGLGGQPPDLTVVFVSAHHALQYELVPELLRRVVDGGVLVGCSGGGVIGAGREVEHRPGVAITSAHLPDVELVPVRVEQDELPDPDALPESWEALVKTPAAVEPHFLLLADPYSIRAESLLQGLDYAFPRSAKIGGLASGAQQPGDNALYLSDGVYSSGVVGVAMHGAIEIDTIVAQGCRPIGRPMRVTSCHQNLLVEVDGVSTLEVLHGIIGGLGERDRQLVQHSLFLGVVMDELSDSPELGDFLIRNIIGIDHARARWRSARCSGRGRRCSST